ncbi:MAG: hypothetical protein ACLRFI_03330 [Alphaproteobacteria bacterium]
MGNILNKVMTKIIAITTEAANTSVSSLDNKTGGSVRFCTSFLLLIYLIVEKNMTSMQVKKL